MRFSTRHLTMPARQLCADRSGIAYIEFGISLPFLMFLLMGSIEMTRFILVSQKVEKTAMTISNSVAVGSTISTSDLNNIVYAAIAVMKPYSFGSNGYVIISSVAQTGTYSVNNPPIVKWQYASSGTTGSWTQSSKIGQVTQTAALPGGLTLNDKDNVIVTEVYYQFTPLIATDGIIGTKTLYSVGLYKPRLGALTTLSYLQPTLQLTGEVL